MQPGRVFVTGARSTIGSLLMPLLAERGIEVCVLGRETPGSATTDSWRYLDLANTDGHLPPIQAKTLIHTAGLWLLEGWLERFHAQGVRRVVMFGSTSRFTKLTSASGYELSVVDKLVSAEDHAIAECQRLGIKWTLFRPTLIYGGINGDRNVADIGRFIRKFGFFPLFGAARGLRQPVHARDLAIACIQSMGSQASYNTAYNLSGGETLAYADMVHRIFETLRRRPVFVSVPIGVFKGAVYLAKFLPRFSHLTSDMALRMQVDLVFDHSDATRDFGYSPRAFDPSYLRRLF